MWDSWYRGVRTAVWGGTGITQDGRSQLLDCAADDRIRQHTAPARHVRDLPRAGRRHRGRGPAGNPGALAYYVTGIAGFLCVALACLGRIWCSVFIAGHKDEMLVTTGPYARLPSPALFPVRCWARWAWASRPARRCCARSSCC